MSFMSEISFEDLGRLRKVVRGVHMSYYPSDQVNDRGADRIIESFGPELVDALLRRAVDEKLVS